MLLYFVVVKVPIHLTKNNCYYDRLKYIDVKHHFMQDIVVVGKVVVQKSHIR